MQAVAASEEGASNCCGEDSSVVQTALPGGCCSSKEDEVMVRKVSTGGCGCGESGTGMLPQGNSGQPTRFVTARFLIEGLGCSCEGLIVEKRVRALPGITTFSLNPITNQMKLEYDPLSASIKDIEDAVRKAGVTSILVKSG